jgi:hypothetical protein
MDHYQEFLQYVPIVSFLAGVATIITAIYNHGLKRLLIGVGILLWVFAGGLFVVGQLYPPGVVQTQQPPAKLTEPETKGNKDKADGPLAVVKTEKAEEPPGIAKPKTPEQPAAAAKSGFWPLFDGNELAEWSTWDGKVADPPRFLSKSKSVVSVGLYPGFLTSRRDDFRDFHIRLEMRSREFGDIPQIVLRREDSFKGYHLTFVVKPVDQKPWVELSADVLERLCKREITQQIAQGEWFTVDIVAKGGSLAIKVNGEPTVNYHDKANRYRSGGISLIGGDFRKIEVKELPVP